MRGFAAGSCVLRSRRESVSQEIREVCAVERLRARKAQRENVRVAVAWYSEEQWGRVKARAVDPELFEATYPEWMEMAEDALRDIRAAIGNPIMINVDTDELAAWCLVHGKQNDSSARAEFASYKLGQRDTAA